MSHTALRIRYGGLTMQGDDADALGLNISEDAFTGWDDAPDSSYDETSIPGEDGSWDVEVTLASRLVSVEGYCLADSIGKLGWWKGALNGQMARPAARPFVVEKFETVQWALAHAVGVKFPVFGGQTFADFKMDFWMPNPRIFGATGIFAEGQAAVQYGNRGATPVFTVNGTRPSGYTIGGPGGRVLTVIAPVVTGHPHVFDMATGELTIDGALVDGKVTVGDTWQVPPGTAWTHTITGGSGPFQTALTETSI